MARWWCWLLVSLAACGDETASEPDTTGADTLPEDTSLVDTVEVADTLTDTGPPPPRTLSERGYVEVRTIVHLHSAFSHDGCDEAGLDAEGEPNMACVRRMKAALCGENIGVAFMTDHPAHMREQPFETLLYAEEGDTVVRNGDGVAESVRFACADPAGGFDGHVTLFVGFEGTHLMGVGLARHLDPIERYSTDLTDTTPSEDISAAIAAVRAAGGFVTVAHSEQEELSAQTIIAHDVSAMELYNFHANFNVVLGTDLGDKLFALEDFVDSEAEVPDPDLTALVMFDRYPEPALLKWRAVSAARPITAFAGSDVHENVLLPAFCATEGLCDELAKDYPHLVERLTTGGPVWQSDEERLDGYARIFGWVQNRVLVPAPAAGADVGPAVREAFVAGRNVVVFEVLGEATGHALVAEDAQGALHDIGATVGAGAALWVRAPDLPLPGGRASWTDGSAAAIESVLWRTTADGTSEVLRWSEPSTWRVVPAEEVTPGVYHLEVFITPHHLADALGPADRLAHGTYRWVETNAIYVEAP